MKSLALIQGDLAIDGTGDYLTFSGVDRIRQDMTLALTEEYGADRFHPAWGSILKEYIGQPITPELEQAVRAEINRVAQNYITLQQQEVLRDTQFDVQGRFDTSDVVRSISNIQVRFFFDAIYVSATLTTLARDTVTISRQVGL
jgi:phage baseplate assembly protein W